MASKSKVLFITEIAYVPIAFFFGFKILKSPGFSNKVFVDKGIPSWVLPELNQITITEI